MNPAIVSVAEINRKNYHPGKFTFSCHRVRRWCSVIWACSGRSDVLLREPIFHHVAFFYLDVNFKRLLLAPSLLQRKQSNSWCDRFCFLPCQDKVQMDLILVLKYSQTVPNKNGCDVFHEQFPIGLNLWRPTGTSNFIIKGHWSIQIFGTGLNIFL